ncbi:MAG TPA: acetylxylan esterase [Chthoniobacteraceae bacterium]|nr:acetylxylan esterase [Chthoniobacteraceae bacterium]
MSFDLPLSELLTYQGRNPRPADFDAYWDQSLEELCRHDPRPELVAYPELGLRHAESFDLWFEGLGGARIHARYLRPKNLAKPAPVLLFFHGYRAGPGSWLQRLGHVLEGFCVVSLDCRGQNGLSDDRLQVSGPTQRGHIVRGVHDPDPRQLYYRYQMLDAALLARIVQGFPEVDPRRVGCCGGSQGGALAAACAALQPDVAAIAVTFPFLCDYQRVWEMGLCQDAYQELKDYFRHFDPRHEREREIFTRLGYIDLQYLAPRIKARVLFSTGLSDRICPPSTQFAFYNKLRCEKELLVYPDFGHEVLPGNEDRELRYFIEMLGQND